MDENIALSSCVCSPYLLFFFFSSLFKKEFSFLLSQTNKKESFLYSLLISQYPLSSANFFKNVKYCPLNCFCYTQLNLIIGLLFWPSHLPTFLISLFSLSEHLLGMFTLRATSLPCLHKHTTCIPR